MDLTISNQLEGNKNIVVREYRKGNWTVEETMVLIEAKKMDDERRIMKRSMSSNEYQKGKQAELRWKWIEDYCWKNECFRSQNQCNDKWDNLMRDYKKVREYERRVVRDIQEKSYWKIDKNERRDNNLPSNMLLQIYEALVEVVDRKDKMVVAVTTGGAAAAPAASNIDNVRPIVLEKSVGALSQHSIPPPVLQQQQKHHPHQAQALLPQLPPPAQTPAEPAAPTFPFSPPLPTVDSDTSEHSDSPAKRRKRRDTGAGDGGGEGTSGGGVGAGSSGTLMGEVGWAISKSASIMAKAIQSREEREDRRHSEVLRLHERSLQIEESKAEMNRQSINNLTDAINKLATSILALAARKNQPP